MSREPYSRIMPPTLNAGFEWRTNSYWARLELTYADRADNLSSADRLDNQRIPSAGTPAYTLVNLRAGWQLADRFGLTLALKNLLDEA